MCSKIVFFISVVLIGEITSENEHNVTNIEVKSIQSYLATQVLKSSNSSKNMVVSILPLHFSFCKLASVAEGAAKTELMKALGFTNDKMVRNCYTKFSAVFNMLKQTDLTLVNKIYVNYSDDIKQDFVANSTMLYAVHVDKVGFIFPGSAVGFINRGIAGATFSRVKDVVESKDIDRFTTMLLVTAAHFKPTWETPFDASNTKTRKFRNHKNKIVDIPMMSKYDSYLYYDSGEFKFITIRLGAGRVSMTFVISATATGLPVFLQKLHQDPDLLVRTRGMMRWTQAKLLLPRFKIKSRLDLSQYLKQDNVKNNLRLPQNERQPKIVTRLSYRSKKLFKIRISRHWRADLAKYFFQIGINEILSSNCSGLNKIRKQSSKNMINIYPKSIKQSLFMEVDEFGVARFNRDVDKLIQAPRVPPNMLEVTADRPFYFTVNLGLENVAYELFNGVFYGPE